MPYVCGVLPADAATAFPLSTMVVALISDVVPNGAGVVNEVLSKLVKTIFGSLVTDTGAAEKPLLTDGKDQLLSIEFDTGDAGKRTLLGIGTGVGVALL